MVVGLIVRTIMREDEGDVDGLVFGLEDVVVQRVRAGALVFYAVGAARLLEQEAFCARRIRCLWIAASGLR